MSHAPIDQLEARTLFAAGPVVNNETILSDGIHMTGIVITFSSAMDPTSVQNGDNYRFNGTRGGAALHRRFFDTVVYDDSAHTVTMTFGHAFKLKKFKHIKIAVLSEKPGEVADSAGNLVDGDRDGIAGGDSVTRFKIARGQRLTYKDADHDRVSLKLSGSRGKKMISFIGPSHNIAEIIVLGETNVLHGTIRLHDGSDGQTVIGRVVLTDPTNSSELAAPFVVGQTVIDGQSPVDPLVVTLP